MRPYVVPILLKVLEYYYWACPSMTSCYWVHTLRVFVRVPIMLHVLLSVGETFDLG